MAFVFKDVVATRNVIDGAHCEAVVIELQNLGPMLRRGLSNGVTTRGEYAGK